MLAGQFTYHVKDSVQRLAASEYFKVKITLQDYKWKRMMGQV